ncbi:MAG: FeoA family protein [Alphaproteobacteria bacterium]|nr:FeoA family protein [Alphaproteobacteria bacterium]
MNLTELKIGKQAKIIKVLDSPFYTKLLEMGCLPNEDIIITCKAPFGDPLAINLGEAYNLSLRFEEAKSILVELI